MSKKYIDIMDTTFRDGFQSVFGGRVLMQDFMPAVEEAAKAGVKHFEFGGGARFQSLFFYLNENAFDMMDRFREIVGPDANLQTLSRGINTVALDTGSREIVDLHAKMFKKHGTTTIRNFDALNDVSNLSYSAECVNRHGLKHEAVITMMDLPPGCEGAHTVEFYEKILKQILDSGMKFSSLCFKDASGTSHPKKVYETIKMAKSLLPDSSHVRFHTHETAGVSVACYLAALEAGADGIDTAVDPLSGGTSQPDILTMLHATKNSNYNLGDLENNKILKYREVLIESLKEYYFPSEAQKVSPLIPFSPMPGGALTANTQMMRDNNILEKFPSVIDAMGEVVSKGGYGTSVTPVSQFYWQQAFSNVMFGEWEKIADGYGRMVLGYFGKTPTTPDSKIVELASKQLELEPTTENPLDIADRDERKSLDYWKNILSEKEIDTTEENIFIAAACAEKGIEFLEGKGKVNVRKITDEESSSDNKASKKSSKASTYTIVLNGESFNVQVAEGSDVEIAPTTGNDQSSSSQSTNDTGSADGESVPAPVNGNVIKVLCSIGDSVEPDQTVMVLESMKMEIEVKAGVSGKVNAITVDQGQNVEEGETILLVS
ncbi:MAG: biotin/lipoyl-containing protein [Thermodesulfobacteriota bacterium]|nr:MAG: biotin attachment protein [Candidatus Dadabacteria bacterium]|tara:strand:- start:3298 stop:5106 length:1809 start_codon:yes stop_codon:yes gene_type:complete